MSAELPSGVRPNEWLNSSLGSHIPPKVPMGENLKAEWTPTDRVSLEPVQVTLDDNWELEVHWQEYRWVKELELLGQIYLNKQLLYLVERSCVSIDDPMRPYVLYHRDHQKSVCVTNLIAALQDNKHWNLQFLHPTPSIFVVYFQDGQTYCSFAVNVQTREAQIYTSDSEEFPEDAPNLYQRGLIPDVSDDQLLAKAGAAVDHSQTQAAISSIAGRKAEKEDQEVARWGSTGRIPPFFPSGLPRVDHANKFIKAPFKETQKAANPMVTVRHEEGS